MLKKTCVILLILAGLFSYSNLEALPTNVPELTNECLTKNNAASCWYLGEHAKNSGNINDALKWYQEACQIDGFTGCSALAKYELENGNREKAIAIYKEMCLLKPRYSRGTDGYAGCYALGKMADNPKESAKWFELGCKKRDKSACRELETECEK